MSKPFFKQLVGIIFLMMAYPAFAHFHYNIDVTNTLQVNQNNQLTGFRFSWVYNEEVSQIMLEDNPDLNAFGKGLMEDLNELGYFTQVQLNGKPLPTTKVTSYHLDKINLNNKPRLKLSFTLPLAAPVNLTGNNMLTIEHPDPSGSAIVTYRDVNHILLADIKKTTCKPSIKNKPQVEHGKASQTIQISCRAI